MPIARSHLLHPRALSSELAGMRRALLQLAPAGATQRRRTYDRQAQQTLATYMAQPRRATHASRIGGRQRTGGQPQPSYVTEYASGRCVDSWGWACYRSRRRRATGWYAHTEDN